MKWYRRSHSHTLNNLIPFRYRFLKSFPEIPGAGTALCSISSKASAVSLLPDANAAPCTRSGLYVGFFIRRLLLKVEQ